jgi:hypothetical protein|tara:strand:+ start:469 stop:939 length:471 start_codon:yes stop_codon:yes gene_type:complete
MTLAAVTDADATAYFATTSRNAEWVALTSHDIWLNEAFNALNNLTFDTTATCSGGPSFDDAWKITNSELALALSKDPTALIGGVSTAQTQGALKRNKLDTLEQEFYDVQSGSASAARFGPSDPLVFQKFPWLYDYLKCYVVGVCPGSSGLILRVRS